MCPVGVRSAPFALAGPSMKTRMPRRALLKPAPIVEMSIALRPPILSVMGPLRMKAQA